MHFRFLLAAVLLSSFLSGADLKVMSYNIHYGVGMDKKTDIARIAKIIESEAPDLVGLQEIGSKAMADELGELTGMKVVFGASFTDGYGDAILTKHPFESLGNHAIPSASGSRYQAMAIDVDLSATHGKGVTVRLINTHFDWLNTIGSRHARLAAARLIEEAFLTDDSTLAILTGDLNAGPESQPMKLLKQFGWQHETKGMTLETCPGSGVPMQIDYVLTRPQGSLVTESVVLLDEKVASDHLPVVKVVRLSPKD